MGGKLLKRGDRSYYKTIGVWEAGVEVTTDKHILVYNPSCEYRPHFLSYLVAMSRKARGCVVADLIGRTELFLSPGADPTSPRPLPPRAGSRVRVPSGGRRPVSRGARSLGAASRIPDTPTQEQVERNARSRQTIHAHLYSNFQRPRHHR